MLWNMARRRVAFHHRCILFGVCDPVCWLFAEAPRAPGSIGVGFAGVAAEVAKAALAAPRRSRAARQRARRQQHHRPRRHPGLTPRAINREAVDAGRVASSAGLKPAIGREALDTAAVASGASIKAGDRLRGPRRAMPPRQDRCRRAIGRDTFDAPTAASGEIVASMRAVSLTGAIVSAPARRRERSSPILMLRKTPIDSNSIKGTDREHAICRKSCKRT